MKIGTDEHKQRSCDDFIASQNPHDPESLPWPELDEGALGRVRAIPFWPGVLHTERRAGAIVEAYGATVDDPLVQRAVMPQVWEQGRRGRAAPWLRSAVAARYYLRTIGRLLGIVRRGQTANGGTDFSPTQASVFIDGFLLRLLVGECCAEHARRMRSFAPDLLQARFLPQLAAVVLAGLRLGAGIRRSR